MIAFFDSLGFQEMFLLVVIGLLLYGRNLPQAGRSLGRTMAKVKRAFDDFKRQIDREADLRDVRDSLKDAAKDLKRAADVPRKIANPVQAAKSMAREALLAPAAEPEPAVTDATEPADAEPAGQPDHTASSEQSR